MAEDLIKAKIVFDTSNLKGVMGSTGGGGSGGSGGGFTGAISKSLFAQDTQIWGDIMGGIGGLVLLGEAMLKVTKAGFGKLVSSSIHLQGTLKILGKTFMLMLKPIGDTMSMFLRPFAISFLRIILPIYKAWAVWMKDGGGAEAKLIIGEGFQEIISGFKELDFQKMWEGFGTVMKGVKDFFLSFATDVLNPQLDSFYEWWDRAQKEFETSGVFSTMFAIFKEMALEGIKYFFRLFGFMAEGEEIKSFGDILSKIFSTAWGGFIKLLKKTEWGETLVLFGEGIWDIWLNFAKKLRGFSWADPLAPFFLAFGLIWDFSVGKWIKSLVTALEDKLPGFSRAIKAIFGGDKENSDGGFLSGWMDKAKEWVSMAMHPGETIIGGLGKIFETAEEKLGKSGNEKGATVMGAFNKTTDVMLSNISVVNRVTEVLNGIPTLITTIHKIITVYESRGSSSGSSYTAADYASKSSLVRE